MGRESFVLLQGQTRCGIACHKIGGSWDLGWAEMMWQMLRPIGHHICCSDVVPLATPPQQHCHRKSTTEQWLLHSMSLLELCYQLLVLGFFPPTCTCVCELSTCLIEDVLMYVSSLLVESPATHQDWLWQKWVMAKMAVARAAPWRVVHGSIGHGESVVPKSALGKWHLAKCRDTDVRGFKWSPPRQDVGGPGGREQRYPTKISALFRKEVANNSQCWRGLIFWLPQFQRSIVTMGTQNCELLYSKLCVTLKNSFHVKIPLKNVRSASSCGNYLRWGL